MDISQITDHLYIGANVKGVHADALRHLDIRLTISMIAHKRPPKELAEPPASTLWLRTFDFVLLPIPVEKLTRGVREALPVIDAGHGVLTYCQAGRHRSVAIASCILIGLGYKADEAMALVHRQRRQADPYAGHIQRQILKFERFWLEECGDLTRQSP